MLPRFGLVEGSSVHELVSAAGGSAAGGKSRRHDGDDALIDDVPVDDVSVSEMGASTVVKHGREFGSYVAAKGRIELFEEENAAVRRITAKELRDSSGCGRGIEMARIAIDRQDLIGEVLHKIPERDRGAEARVDAGAGAVGGTGEIVGDDQHASHSSSFLRERLRSDLSGVAGDTRLPTGGKRRNE